MWFEPPPPILIDQINERVLPGIKEYKRLWRMQARLKVFRILYSNSRFGLYIYSSITEPPWALRNGLRAHGVASESLKKTMQNFAKSNIFFKNSGIFLRLISSFGGLETISRGSWRPCNHSLLNQTCRFSWIGWKGCRNYTRWTNLQMDVNLFSLLNT